MLVGQIVEKMNVTKCILDIFSVIQHSLLDDRQNVLFFDLVDYCVTRVDAYRFSSGALKEQAIMSKILIFF